MLDNTDLTKRLADAEVVAVARERYTELDAYQGRIKTDSEVLHHYYAPRNGDQWPEDIRLRPGKIHMTVNIVKPVVNVDSRLQSVLPRIVLKPDGLDERSRARAEAAEKLMLDFLEQSGWDVWFNDLCRIKSLYRKGVLKVLWNKEDKRPDVIVLENPSNLRIGWGTSDFRVMDWTIYEYGLSPLQAMRQFPGIVVLPNKGAGKPLIVTRTGDHADPLNNLTQGTDPRGIRRPGGYMPSEYEGKQVRVWDYWYRDADDVVCNALILEGVLAQEITKHKYLPDIPYIVIENDHEPGSPEGMSTAEDIIDLQIEFNRAISQWVQLIVDNLDPAWQIDADSVPPGIVPRGGEILAAGEGKHILPLDKAINALPVDGLMGQFMEMLHFSTGLSEVLFGKMPGAQTSGRALAVQVDAAANRMDPKRRRLYKGLRELLIFWVFMCEKVNPKMPVGTDEEGNPIRVGLKELIGGFRRWKIIPPEITPRDIIENTQNEISKMTARAQSLRTTMDALGTDSPEDEIKLIEMERSNPHLFPGDVQVYTAVLAALQQLQQQGIAMDQQQPSSAIPAANDQRGVAAVQQQNQQAVPPGMEDQNQQGSLPGGMVPPQGGGVPAPGAPPTGAPTNTTLIRAQPNGQALPLNQMRIGG